MKWARLEPWEGYFICNQGIEPVTLFVNPKEAPQIAQDKMSKIEDLNRTIHLEEQEWMYCISAITKNVKDLDNYAGIRRSAKQGWDMTDSPEPPPVGNYISLYFLLQFIHILTAEELFRPPDRHQQQDRYGGGDRSQYERPRQRTRSIGYPAANCGRNDRASAHEYRP